MTNEWSLTNQEAALIFREERAAITEERRRAKRLARQASWNAAKWKRCARARKVRAARKLAEREETFDLVVARSRARKEFREFEAAIADWAADATEAALGVDDE